MKVTTLAGIGVVVADLDRAMAGYARLLGLDDWLVQDWTTERLSAMVSHGRRSAGTYRSAVGWTPFDAAGEVLGKPQRAVPFELVQPTSGETPFAEFLLGKGEGIAFLTVVADDAAPPTARCATTGARVRSGTPGPTWAVTCSRWSPRPPNPPERPSTSTGRRRATDGPRYRCRASCTSAWWWTT